MKDFRKKCVCALVLFALAGTGMFSYQGAEALVLSLNRNNGRPMMQPALGKEITGKDKKVKDKNNVPGEEEDDDAEGDGAEEGDSEITGKEGEGDSYTDDNDGTEEPLIKTSSGGSKGVKKDSTKVGSSQPGTVVNINNNGQSTAQPPLLNSVPSTQGQGFRFGSGLGKSATVAGDDDLFSGFGKSDAPVAATAAQKEDLRKKYCELVKRLFELRRGLPEKDLVVDSQETLNKKSGLNELVYLGLDTVSETKLREIIGRSNTAELTTKDLWLARQTDLRNALGEIIIEYLKKAAVDLLDLSVEEVGKCDRDFFKNFYNSNFSLSFLDNFHSLEEIKQNLGNNVVNFSENQRRGLDILIKDYPQAIDELRRALANPAAKNDQVTLQAQVKAILEKYLGQQNAQYMLSGDRFVWGTFITNLNELFTKRPAGLQAASSTTEQLKPEEKEVLERRKKLASFIVEVAKAAGSYRFESEFYVSALTQDTDQARALLNELTNVLKQAVDSNISALPTRELKSAYLYLSNKLRNLSSTEPSKNTILGADTAGVKKAVDTIKKAENYRFDNFVKAFETGFNQTSGVFYTSKDYQQRLVADYVDLYKAVYAKLSELNVNASSVTPMGRALLDIFVEDAPAFTNSFNLKSNQTSATADKYIKDTKLTGADGRGSILSVISAAVKVLSSIDDVFYKNNFENTSAGVAALNKSYPILVRLAGLIDRMYPTMSILLSRIADLTPEKIESSAFSPLVKNYLTSMLSYKSNLANLATDKFTVVDLIGVHFQFHVNMWRYAAVLNVNTGKHFTDLDREPTKELLGSDGVSSKITYGNLHNILSSQGLLSIVSDNVDDAPFLTNSKIWRIFYVNAFKKNLFGSFLYDLLHKDIFQGLTLQGAMRAAATNEKLADTTYAIASAATTKYKFMGPSHNDTTTPNNSALFNKSDTAVATPEGQKNLLSNTVLSSYAQIKGPFKGLLTNINGNDNPMLTYTLSDDTLKGPTALKANTDLEKGSIFYRVAAATRDAFDPFSSDLDIFKAVYTDVTSSLNDTAVTSKSTSILREFKIDPSKSTELFKNGSTTISTTPLEYGDLLAAAVSTDSTNYKLPTEAELITLPTPVAPAAPATSTNNMIDISKLTPQQVSQIQMWQNNNRFSSGSTGSSNVFVPVTSNFVNPFSSSVGTGSSTYPNYLGSSRLPSSAFSTPVFGSGSPLYVR